MSLKRNSDGAAVDDSIVDALMSRLEANQRDSDAKWETRLQGFAKELITNVDQRIQAQAAEQDIRWDSRLKAMAAELRVEIGAVDKKVVGSSMASGASAVGSLSLNRRPGTMNPRDEGFVPRLEIKGFVKDWEQRHVQGYTTPESNRWLSDLYKLLPEQAVKMIDMEATSSLQNVPIITKIFIRTHGNQAWALRAFVLKVLTDNKLCHRGETLKLAVEDPPSRIPLKAAMGLAKSVLIRRFNLTPDAVRGDYKLPEGTIYWQDAARGIRQTRVLTWIEETGFAVHLEGCLLAGITNSAEEIMLALSS